MLVFCIGINHANGIPNLYRFRVLDISVGNLWLGCTVKSQHCFSGQLFTTHLSHVRNQYIMTWKSMSDFILYKLFSPSNKQLLLCCVCTCIKWKNTQKLVCWAASCPDNSWSLSVWFLPFLVYQSVAVTDCCACSLTVFSVHQSKGILYMRNVT